METVNVFVPEIKISYSNPTPVKDRIKLLNSQQVVKLLRSIWNNDNIELQETYKVIFLNSQLEVLGYLDLTTGSTHGCFVDIKLIFGVACKAAARKIILAHNHPCGGLVPSRQDSQHTQKIKEIAILLEMVLLDHFIITKEGYFSMSDSGMM